MGNARYRGFGWIGLSCLFYLLALSSRAEAAGGPIRLPADKIQTISGREIQILDAETLATSKGVIVSGTVESRPAFENAMIRDHLEITAFGPNGSILASVSTRYFPRPIPSQKPWIQPRAVFAEELPVNFRAISLIRVVYKRDE